MAKAVMDEQTNPGAQSAGVQAIYPKAGAFCRVDSTGTEKVILDSAGYAAYIATIQTYLNYGGV